MLKDTVQSGGVNLGCTDCTNGYYCQHKGQ